MPTLFSFESFKLKLYFREHGTPHIHLISPDHDVVIAISDGSVIEGHAPAEAIDMARRFIADHQDELMNLWRSS